MNSLFARTPLKRSSRTRSRKNSTSETMDIVCQRCDSAVSRRKTRPPPLQIVPEMSENVLDISPMNSPPTARPTRSVAQRSTSHTSCITLSAYAFSIDDALLMFGEEAPGSPALSASASTSDGASSEGVPTPGTSDDEDGYNSILPTRLHPQRVSIRPLCITKTRSSICHEDDDFPNYLEKEEEKPIPLPVTETEYDPLTPVEAMGNIAEETEECFYSHEFGDFISFTPVVPSFASPARRDSLILTEELSSGFIKVPKLKHRNCSRHSKPLPLLPPVTPPVSSLPSAPTFPLVQTTAQKSVFRRKRNISAFSDYPPSLAPVESRLLPRKEIPLDIEDGGFPEETLEVSSHQIIIEQVYNAENPIMYSQPSYEYSRPASTFPPPPAISESAFLTMTLPRSSTDSDVSRSSIDSASSSASSASSNTCASPLSFLSSLFCEDDEPEATEQMRSRWSSSTLASLAAEQQQSTTLLLPFRNFFGSHPRWVTQKTSPQTPPHRHLLLSKSPKNKRGFSMTPTPPSALPKHIRQQGSRSSTSSAGTDSSDGERHDGLPGRMKRKPTPMAMFLHAT